MAHTAYAVGNSGCDAMACPATAATREDGVTQVGEGRGAGYETGAPAGGEILAERYQLEQHVNTDRAGRQIWRGVDVVLRRPVAIVVRYPGGTAAAEMLQTAVQASRVVHPHLVGVYDAIDEHARAYVVREWIDGGSLREAIATGVFDAAGAIAIGQGCAAAMSALHAAGMSHGNLHPGTVLIDPDGRVVVADAHADRAGSFEEDVRAVGALLYFALTGYWPHAEVPGPADLPDAVRDGTGALAAPRQVRAGVPDYLDNLIMDLLDQQLSLPTADVLAGELSRLETGPEGAFDTEPDGYSELDPAASGPIRFPSRTPDQPVKPSGRRLMIGLAGLLAAGLVGLLVGVTWLAGASDPGSSGPGAGPGGASPGAEPPVDASGTAAPIPLSASQLRVVDPPNGDRTELDGIEATIDDDLSTSWRTDTYNSSTFGNIKPGMGILIDLGEPRRVDLVRVELATGGATAELRVGDRDPGNSQAGDDEIYQTYQPLGEPQQGGTTMVFSAFDSESTYQYLMIWFTDLAPVDGGFRVEVQQITVEGY